MTAALLPVPPDVADLVAAPNWMELKLHGDALVHVVRHEHLEEEWIARRAIEQAPVRLESASALTVPFVPGVSARALVLRLMEEGAHLEEEVAAVLLSDLALLLSMVHRRTGHRAGDLTDERIWLHFDGTVGLLGPLSRAKAFAGRERLASLLPIDVWRIGALAASLVTSQRATHRLDAWTNEDDLYLAATVGPPGRPLDQLAWSAPETPVVPSPFVRPIAHALTSHAPGDAGHLVQDFRALMGGSPDPTRRALAETLGSLFAAESEAAAHLDQAIAPYASLQLEETGFRCPKCGSPAMTDESCSMYEFSFMCCTRCGYGELVDPWQRDEHWVA